jgi:signal transduction histidine kinase
MDWVREHYFPAVADQVARIANPEGGIKYAIRDERNLPVVDAQHSAPAPRASRDFAIAFFNPLYTGVEPPPDLTYQTWTAEALVLRDPTLTAANRWAHRSLGVMAITALVLTIGLMFAVSVARANANIAEMRSEYVSAVTHELKTPIAALMTISETLASGRSSAEMQRDYAQMAVDETKRLHLLIENLLAYARITDVADVYSVESVDVEELLDDMIHTFDWRLQRDGFVLDMLITPGLPPIQADRSAVALALSNVIDNAIRYSRDRRHLTIRARLENAHVVVDVCDRGVGISAEDVPHVRRRFVRGRKVTARGSGLGLAICDRIVTDHGGSITIDSTSGIGTTVSLRFPTRKQE